MPTDRVLLALELQLERCKQPPGERLTIVASRPGRDGTYTRRWQGNLGRLTASQWRDVQAWVQLQLQTALLTTTGIQEELET